ncbi:MAG: diguanylate cyclase [Peptococcaceae bacterium]|nr:diguanylate cyclase [Peptococcaceae bacterium]
MQTTENKPIRMLLSEGKTAKRFRNANIVSFFLALIIMSLSMILVYNGVIRDVSFDFAGRYAVSSAAALSARFENEIGLLSKAAHSPAVTAWLSDEANREKQILAFTEMSYVVGELYSNNLYIGVDKTQREYQITESLADDDLLPVADLLRQNPDDAWYFACIDSERDYELSVNMDYILHKKRVWLDYKIMQDGKPIGVICTGMDFTQIVWELFTHSDSLHARGLIIDKDGLIRMDSYLLNEEGLLNRDDDLRIEEAYPDKVFLSALGSYLSGIDTYAQTIGDPVVIRPGSGRYRYASIMPILYTDWTAVILYDHSSLFGMSRFLPAFVIILLILIVFALCSDAISYLIFFKPLELLVHSLVLLKENRTEHIYGIERDDEFGKLSNTIIDLFAMANYDALTGIHNRRYMETNLQQIMDFLSRSNGLLSVLMMDVDHFKFFNDTYGHQEGDRCLRSVAQAIAGSVTRASDFVARYGGEEFIVILPNTNQGGVRLVAEKILEAVKALNIPHTKNSAADCVTISIGITTGYVQHQQNWKDYIKRADEALYTSKQSGRNRYTFINFT